MTFSPVPKPTTKRRKPKRGQRGKFSKRTRDMIIERDEGRCRQCGAIGTEIHHVFPKGRNGRGTFSNGILLCASCHRLVHEDVIYLNKWIDEFQRTYGNQFYKDGYDI